MQNYTEYPYTTLETINLNVFSQLQRLFTNFGISYISSTEIDEDNDKIYKISYNLEEVQENAKVDEFLSKLEDLAIRYNL